MALRTRELLRCYILRSSHPLHTQPPMICCYCLECRRITLTHITIEAMSKSIIYDTISNTPNLFLNSSRWPSVMSRLAWLGAEAAIGASFVAWGKVACFSSVEQSLLKFVSKQFKMKIWFWNISIGKTMAMILFLKHRRVWKSITAHTIFEFRSTYIWR